MYWTTYLLSLHQSSDNVCHLNLVDSVVKNPLPTSTPETFDIVSKTVDIAARKNLAQISKVLTQIASGSDFGDDSPNYVPINDYVRKAIAEMTSWFLEGMFFFQ